MWVRVICLAEPDDLPHDLRVPISESTTYMRSLGKSWYEIFIGLNLVKLILKVLFNLFVFNMR